ncbi:hypothetical protein OH76DRAFT_250420 [Lentinus brumalis]|uniref:Uncharacterized protein n=1 Tax=Lentinus brumalis TaxID=2498619 RepID=A0A371CLJ1_9APHY|nr:hypothetical protein OH76DRAFT_250420 [Polyporus brumalis]
MCARPALFYTSSRIIQGFYVFFCSSVARCSRMCYYHSLALLLLLLRAPLPTHLPLLDSRLSSHRGLFRLRLVGGARRRRRLFLLVYVRSHLIASPNGCKLGLVVE